MNFVFLPLCIIFLTPSSAAAQEGDVDQVWRERLRSSFFADRPIIEGDGVIQLEAPIRAADPATVPISIQVGFPQSEERYIKTITVLIDNNPAPLVGRFHFGPRSGRADLGLRVRVNEYTPVRAIAETNDGQLYMSSRFVKATGGCAAPVGSDLDKAMARIGKMKFKMSEKVRVGESTPAQLLISHPNITGLQMDQLTRLYHPAHFVQTIDISYGGERVLAAETDISISENPSLRFHFIPDETADLAVEVVDSNAMEFSRTVSVIPKE